MIPRSIYKLLFLAAICSLFALNAVADTASFQQAQDLYKKAAWQPALELFAGSIAKSTGSDEIAAAHFFAGECAMQLSDYLQAQEHYDQVLAIAGDQALKANAQFRSSEARYLAGDVVGAARGFREFADGYPRHKFAPSAYNYLGQIAAEADLHDQAVTSYNFVIENFSTGPEVDQARLGLARVLLATGRGSEVPVCLGRLCQHENHATAAEAILLLGRSKYEVRQYDQALSAFRRIYELEATPAQQQRAHLGAGWALWNLGRPDEISAEISLLAKANDCQTECHYLLGMAAYSAEDWGVACRELEQASVELSPHRPSALFYLGESFLKAENTKRAQEIFEQVVRSEPQSEWSDDAAWGLVRTAQVAKSKIDIEEACELLKTKFPQSEYLALISIVQQTDFSAGKNTTGFTLFEEAVALERDGQFNAALAAYREFLTYKNNGTLRAEGLWRTARLHERLKQFAEAKQFYEQLLEGTSQFERRAEALSHLAAIEAERGKQAEAKKHYGELVANFPQSPQAAPAAYWLALAAADEKDNGEAQYQVDWLLTHCDTTEQSLTEEQTRLWEQTLCLQCQLWAESNNWESIKDLLGENEQTGNSAAKARLEFWRAEAALRSGNHAEASERFDKLTSSSVGIVEAWVPMVSLRRAQLAARREDWQAVLKLVDELDAKHPEFELAYECDYLRGRALAGRGEMSSARSAYGDVLENEWATGTETAAMAQWMIGETYFHQRDYEHAAVAYEKVIERHNLPEWQARAALQAGKCAELMEHWDEAREHYSRALDRWPKSASEKQLAARLKWSEEQLAQQPSTLRR